LDAQKHPQSGTQIAIPEVLQMVQKEDESQGSEENINRGGDLQNSSGEFG